MHKPLCQPVGDVHGYDVEYRFGFGSFVQFGHSKSKTQAALSISDVFLDCVAPTGGPIDRHFTLVSASSAFLRPSAGLDRRMRRSLLAGRPHDPCSLLLDMLLSH